MNQRISTNPRASAYIWFSFLGFFLWLGLSDLNANPPIPNNSLTVTTSFNTICSGDSVTITVASSQIGVEYQLLDSYSMLPIGSAFMGTAGNLNLPSGPLFSNITFAILATDTSDGMNILLTTMPAITVHPGISGRIFVDSIPLCTNESTGFSFQDYALDFEATNQYALVPNTPSLNPGNAITVEAWINADTWTASNFEGEVVSKVDFINNTGYSLRIGGAVPQISFEIGQGGGTTFEISNNAATVTGTWYHIAGTYDGTRIRTFLNGVELAMTTPLVGPIAASTQNLHIGRHPLFPSRQFDGKIDEVRIWDYAMTATQIQSRMNQVLGGNETGLVAYYDMNQGPGLGTILDQTSNANHGSLNNMDPATDWLPIGPLLPSISNYAWAFGDANTSTLAMPNHAYINPGPYQVTVQMTDGFGCQENDSLSLNVTADPIVDLGSDTTLCPGASLVLDAGNSGSNFLWDNAAITQMITVATPDTYYVDVTNGSACSSSDTIIISFSPGLTPDLGNDTTICPTTTLPLDATTTGASSYLWSDATAMPTLTVNGPGTYWVDVFDAAGCSYRDSIVVTAATAIPVDLGNDTTLCPGATVALDAGNTGATFLWNTTATTQSITINTPGSYFVDVSNGCTGSDTIVVSFSPGLTPDLGNDTTICTTATLALDGTTTGAVSYLWYDATAMPSNAVNGPGIYWVDVFDAAGCSYRDSIEVTASTALPVSLGNDTTLCPGTSIVLDAGNTGGTFLWNTTAATQTITVNTPGSYFVDVTNGCTGSDTILVNFTPGLTPDLGNDTTICPAATLALDGTTMGAVSYLWSNATAMPTNTVNVVGTYWVDVLDTANCSYRDSIVVTTAPAPAVNLGNDTTICFGDTLTLDAGNAGGTFLWSTGAVSQTILATGPDTFIVSVATGPGCAGVDSLVINEFVPAGDFLPTDTAYCENDSITLMPGVVANSYLWSTGALSASLVVQAPGVYGLDIVDLNGCDAFDSVTVAENPLPLVALTGMAPYYCDDNSQVPLGGNPAGGLFSGPGVTGSLLDLVQLVGPDTISVLYFYTDPNGCANSDSASVIIRALPPASFTSLPPTFCDGDQAVQLLPLPAGGVFAGPGIQLDSFAPVIAGIGQHPITYSFTDAFGCVGVDTQITTVFALPNVILTSPQALLCSSSPAISLAATPLGGTLTGPGITGSNFSPALAGVGLHPINYSFTDANGCFSEDSLEIEVVLQPVAVFTGLDTGYCEGAASVTLTGTPAGGSFSGPGVLNNSFDPNAVLAGGTYDIVYAFSLAANCADSDTQSVAVYQNPNPVVNPIEAAYCETDSSFNLIANPPGGTFSGPGITGTLFEPSLALGASTIRYDFADFRGCSGSDSILTQVDTSPGPAQAGPDQMVYFANTTTLNALPVAVGQGNWSALQGTGNWSDVNDARATASGLATGNNVLAWTVSNGACSSQDEVLVTVLPFETARGFSPNGDGFNDTFEIPGLVDYPGSGLKVFDRLGELVFQADDYQNDWTGDDLSVDTYYYLLEVSNGFQVNGLVLLKR